MTTHILLVEDDPTARMLLADVLEGAGYEVTTALNGETAIRLLAQHVFDVVLTDIQLGQVDGVQVLAAAKNVVPPPAVLLLTGYGSLETSIAALRLGADNYLLKPCEPMELLNCIDNAVRRRMDHLRQVDAIKVIMHGIDQLRGDGPLGNQGAKPNTIGLHPADRYLQIGRLTIDVWHRAISFDHKAIHVTPIEYGLLLCLAQAPGHMLGSSEIVRQTHGYVADEHEAQVLIKPHIRNLRRKLDPAYLVNVRGIGYRLAPPV